VDEAGLFSKNAADSAKKSLEEIDRRYRVPVVIEAVPRLQKDSTFDQAAIQSAKSSGGHGLFVYMAKEEKKLRILTRRELEDRFNADRCDAIRDAFLSGFKSGDFDSGLAKGIETIAKIASETEPVEPFVTRDHLRLTLAGARKVIAAAEAKAVELKVKANIAVVDDGGHLLAFVRMDGARPASAITAQTKAISAATMRQASGALSGTVLSDPATLSGNLGVPLAAATGGARVTTLLGGVPIIVDGEVIGAIGVGAASGEQDAEIARAGSAALGDGNEAEAPAKPK
jgi:glc operon protein GlcG